MTKIDELVKLLAEVDSHCTNTFCNTCPYQQTSGEYPCSFYAIAQKLIDEGYGKVNDIVEYQEEHKRLKDKLQAVLLNADIVKDFSKSISIHEAYAKGAKDIVKEFAEKLKENSIEINSRDFGFVDFVGVDAIDELLKEYENE